MTMTDTLADELPREIARVTAKKERWLGYMRDHNAPGMGLSIALMQAEIEEAISALAAGDAARMMIAYQNLKGYNDDD
jgi:hypothetical protein